MELWRYPVKSMLGERRDRLAITARGALGDRAWALRDTATGRIASAKKFPQLLSFQARYEVEPTFEAAGRIEIILPDGRAMSPDDPDASSIISDCLGHNVRLKNQPHNDEKASIDRTTVFGDVPVHAMKPAHHPTRSPQQSRTIRVRTKCNATVTRPGLRHVGDAALLVTRSIATACSKG